jgi:hypothetical protein
MYKLDLHLSFSEVVWDTLLVLWLVRLVSKIYSSRWHVLQFRSPVSSLGTLDQRPAGLTVYTIYICTQFTYLCTLYTHIHKLNKLYLLLHTSTQLCASLHDNLLLFFLRLNTRRRRWCPAPCSRPRPWPWLPTARWTPPSFGRWRTSSTAYGNTNHLSLGALAVCVWGWTQNSNVGSFSDYCEGCRDLNIYFTGIMVLLFHFLMFEPLLNPSCNLYFMLLCSYFEFE